MDQRYDVLIEQSIVSHADLEEAAGVPLLVNLDVVLTAEGALNWGAFQHVALQILDP